jgi:hypothetical protein
MLLNQICYVFLFLFACCILCLFQRFWFIWSTSLCNFASSFFLIRTKCTYTFKSCVNVTQSLNSLVCIDARLFAWLRSFGSLPGRARILFLQCPDQLWDTPGFVSGRSWLTTCLSLVLRLRIWSCTSTSLHFFISCYWLNHMDNRSST